MQFSPRSAKKVKHQIYFTPSQDKFLHEEACRRNITVSELVRLVINQYYEPILKEFV